MAAEELYSDADWLRISPLAGRTGLRLTGEADIHTEEILRTAMAELPPDSPEIHLQLAGLEFIDVAAARHISMLAGRPARPKVILYYPPRSLIFLLRLLWPESLDRCWIFGERAAPAPRLIPPQAGHSRGGRHYSPPGLSRPGSGWTPAAGS